ncbi:hypothetical protein CKAN_00310700 [Cinnamomum micranthum f. kanehirae]|uniref:Uncharacterized protein n=1 Tax=Cinnamomum micranthum f. kanehirae TaxID=337451 RepID=A0A3S3M7N6_9MAGN|nr:hypothetical protein CKAN_00310700 [Cinnamomum micranthum f. kanehirae]
MLWSVQTRPLNACRRIGLSIYYWIGRDNLTQLRDPMCLLSRNCSMYLMESVTSLQLMNCFMGKARDKDEFN